MIGDVTDHQLTTPVAIREGHAFADTVFGKRPVQVDHATIPTVVFSQPEVGTVGLTEAEVLCNSAMSTSTRRTSRPIEATLSGRDTRVLMKLRGRRHDSDRVRRLPHRRPGTAGELVQAVGDRGEVEGDQSGLRRDDGACIRPPPKSW